MGMIVEMAISFLYLMKVMFFMPWKVCITLEWAWCNGRDKDFHIMSWRSHTEWCESVNRINFLVFHDNFIEYKFEFDKSWVFTDWNASLLHKIQKASLLQIFYLLLDLYHCPNVNLSVMHSIKNTFIAGMDWYYCVAITILHQPCLTDAADITDINTRLLLSDTSSTPPMYDDFLLMLIKCHLILSHLSN